MNLKYLMSKILPNKEQGQREGKFKELEVVALLKDVCEHHLEKGDVGTIVHVYRIPNEAYEVEFIKGDVYQSILLTLLPHEIERRV